MTRHTSGAITATTSTNEAIKQHEVSKLSSDLLEKTVLPGNGTYLMTFLCNNCTVLPFEDFKVYKTTDYSGFSRLIENRDLDEKHVHTLMKSYEDDGYLFTIIYVNERMQWIDGQHRFESAKRKHLPVYFIIMPGWGIKEVTVLNVNSRNWTMEDFLNTHAKGGNENYIMFKEFYDKNDFDITTAQVIILGRRTGKGTTDEFRTGEMKINESQITKAYIKANRIKEFKDFHPFGWKSRNCVEALLTLLNVKGFDHKHLISQLKKYPETILYDARSLRIEEYLKILVEKYNYRKKEKIEIQ